MSEKTVKELLVQVAALDYRRTALVLEEILARFGRYGLNVDERNAMLSAIRDLRIEADRKDDQ